MNAKEHISKLVEEFRQSCCNTGLKVLIFHIRHRLFSHDSKVRNFNFNSKCAFWIKIRKTVALDHVYAKITSRCIIWNVQFKWWFKWRYFGPCVCQITSRFIILNAQFKWKSRPSFELRISNYASQCDFGVHTVQTTIFRIFIQNAHFKLKIKLRTLLSCENSHSDFPVTSGVADLKFPCRHIRFRFFRCWQLSTRISRRNAAIKLHYPFTFLTFYSLYLNS